MKNFNENGDCVTHAGFLMVIGLLILAEILVPVAITIIIAIGAIIAFIIPILTLGTIIRWLFVWKSGNIKTRKTIEKVDK